jgi:dihydroxyacid dehydratase/phosphogluconate dehydratase
MAKLRSGEWYQMFRANPIDGLVLLGGCDKTIPALLMAAASLDLPAIVISGGPMLNGTFRGQPSGCGIDVWRLVTGAFASPKRGWERLYVDHVQRADTGGDLDFLLGASGPGVARESH